MNPEKPELLLAILVLLGAGMPDTDVEFVVGEEDALSTVGAIIVVLELLPPEESAVA